MGSKNSAAEVDSWLDFAISRNVENLAVEIHYILKYGKIYSFGDVFYLSSSLKKLSVLHYYDMSPRRIVYWKSPRELSLRYCKLGDESMDNILSGCPILESLTLSGCILLEHLDLSRSPSLRRLKIASGPIEIVAPHIHYLSLTCYQQPSTLVDVSSLTEANLDLHLFFGKMGHHHFHTMALELVAKSHNVERLTLGPFFLWILSLAELRGVPLPTFKVQTLIIKTKFVRYIIRGIARLLLNSPGLKTLTVDMMKLDQMDMYLERYFDSQGLNSDQCWRSEYEIFPTSKEIYTVLGYNDATSKLLASFMELVLRNAKTLERMVVWLGGIYLNDDEQWFEELLQMVATLSHENDVSIVLKRNNYFKY